MTDSGTVKAALDSKVPDGSGITGKLRNEMWDKLGTEYVAIVIFRADFAGRPAPNSDKDRTVKLLMLDCEIAAGENADQLRELMQAWYRIRTKEGTLDEHLPNTETPAEQANRALLMLNAGAADILDADIVDDPEYLRAQLLALIPVVVESGVVNVGALGRVLDTDDDTIERLLAAAQILGVVGPQIHIDGIDGADIVRRDVLVTADALDGVLADVGSKLSVIFADPPAAAVDETDDEDQDADEDADVELEPVDA
jgi:hypothetical protein